MTCGSPTSLYIQIIQTSEQLSMAAKQATQTPFITLDEMDRVCQLGDVLQREISYVRNDFLRRKNLEV